MPTVELTDQQVIDLLRRLPAHLKREALAALAEGRESRLAYAESQLRQLSSKRGMNWDQMSEDQREAFLDDLVHEDRPCGT
jgi:hypothetical protein